MKLGACYNKLLETSILSIKDNVDYIVVVYQTISNFGHPASPHLEEFLNYLVHRGLVNELVKYEPRLFSNEEKKANISNSVSPEAIGGPLETIGNQFLNELTKREIGRLKCYENGCTHFISMDADEYYLKEELRNAKELVLANNYDATACRMRVFFKEPIYEFFPYDNMNSVPLIYKIDPKKAFKIAHPYPVVLDPTRCVEGYTNFYHFQRAEIEMYHMSFVRKNIEKKLVNVSNRANYGNTTTFLEKWKYWTPEMGALHPHPYIGKIFKEIKIVENFFNIDLKKQCIVCCISQPLFRCSRCKSVRYCSIACQTEHWAVHKLVCSP
eukprot:TRINITY_DN10122_c0_g1_i1.p1 TRINITY_DN10122_c0_g1~~TRINITY_DN10122_c0_g1_i1.p1  ORF type:complete len:326 (+),score=18.81 TRINITY_DN10122_c0_g1_i1:63-1040(+)